MSYQSIMKSSSSIKCIVEADSSQAQFVTKIQVVVEERRVVKTNLKKNVHQDVTNIVKIRFIIDFTVQNIFNKSLFCYSVSRDSELQKHLFSNIKYVLVSYLQYLQYICDQKHCTYISD